MYYRIYLADFVKVWEYINVKGVIPWGDI